MHKKRIALSQTKKTNPSDKIIKRAEKIIERVQRAEDFKAGYPLSFWEITRPRDKTFLTQHHNLIERELLAPRDLTLIGEDTTDLEDEENFLFI